MIDSKNKIKESKLELDFKIQLKIYQIKFEQEVTPISGRKFKFDFYLPLYNILIEIQGGTWSSKKMGHNSGSGIKRDCVKSNIGQLHGFIVLHFTSDMIISGEAINFLNEFLEKKKEEKNGLVSRFSSYNIQCINR